MQPHQPAVTHTSPDMWWQDSVPEFLLPLGDKQPYPSDVMRNYSAGGAYCNHISSERKLFIQCRPQLTQSSYCYMTHSWSTSLGWIGLKISYLNNQNQKTLTITLGSLIKFPEIFLDYFSSYRAFSFQTEQQMFTQWLSLWSVNLTGFHFMAMAAEADGYCNIQRQPYQNNRERYMLFCLDSLCSQPAAVCSGGSMQDIL